MRLRHLHLYGTGSRSHYVPVRIRVKIEELNQMVLFRPDYELSVFRLTWFRFTPYIKSFNRKEERLVAEILAFPQ